MEFGKYTLLLSPFLCAFAVACDTEELPPQQGSAGSGGAIANAGSTSFAGSAGSSVGGAGQAGSSGAASGAGGDLGIAGDTNSAGFGGSAGASGSSSTCGNGSIEAPETCDDSNAVLCDGCENCERRYVLDVPKGASATITGIEQALPSATTPLCYEAWVKTDGSVPDAIYFSSAKSETDINFLLRCRSVTAGDQTETTLEFTVQNGEGITSAFPPIPCHDGKWHHLAGCRRVVGEDLNLRLYWDGQTVASAGGSVADVGALAPIVVGGTGYAKTGLGGAIDELVITERIRSADFIPIRRQSPTSLSIALYHFDEGEGSAFANAGLVQGAGTLAGASFIVDFGYRAEMCE